MMVEPRSTLNLFDLPGPALNLVFDHSSTTYNCAKQYALLRVARQGRDAVLQQAKKVELTLYREDAEGNCQPLARFLDRLCTQQPVTPEGVKLALNAEYARSEHQTGLLTRLLQPAFAGSARWLRVRRLKLKGWTTGLVAAGHMLGPSFPLITHLSLRDVDLGHGSLFAGLASSGLQWVPSTLLSLKLFECELSPAAVPASAAYLRALPFLRSLSIKWGSAGIVGLAAGLTQLTSVCLFSSDTPITQVMQIAEGLGQLQHLGMCGKGPFDISGLQGVLTTCTQLTSLELNTTVDQQAFDVLLQHGAHLSFVTILTPKLTESRATASCTWSSFEWCWSDDLRPWAYLPLHSVQQLTICAQDSSCDSNVFPGSKWLSLPLHVSEQGVDDEQVPVLMQQAVANLMTCPAFQSGRGVWELSLNESEYSSTGSPSAATFPSSTRAQVLQALAPIASRVTRIEMWSKGFKLGKEEVAVLGQVFGKRLRRLTLTACDVQRDFWPAVWSHLPALSYLGLDEYSVQGAIGMNDLSMFCSHAPRPFTLSVGDGVDREELRASASLWSRSRVHVV